MATDFETTSIGSSELIVEFVAAAKSWPGGCESQLGGSNLPRDCDHLDLAAISQSVVAAKLVVMNACSLVGVFLNLFTIFLPRGKRVFW